MNYHCTLCDAEFRTIDETSLSPCPKAQDGKHVFEDDGSVLHINKGDGKRKTVCLWRSILALGAIALLSGICCLVRSCGSDKSERMEQFIPLDYSDVITSSVVLPFERRIAGEHNALVVKLDTIEKIFPYRERISVVLHGSAVLVDSETAHVREQSEAALRYSFALAMDDEGFLTLQDAELDSLSVYSDSPDTEAIVQRKTSEFWKLFASSMLPWGLDLTKLPFKPEQNVQIENDGVFVFGKVMRK